MEIRHNDSLALKVCFNDLICYFSNIKIELINCNLFAKQLV